MMMMSNRRVGLEVDSDVIPRSIGDDDEQQEGGMRGEEYGMSGGRRTR